MAPSRLSNSKTPIKQSAVKPAAILGRIYEIRGQQVMLDSDLASLYGVETGALTRAVRRNKDRFPADFMFRLTKEEFADLRSQSGISSGAHGGRRYQPYVFTEQGVAMLSGVLKSPQAAAVNVEIMRAFVELRRLAASSQEMSRRLDDHKAQEAARWLHPARRLAALSVFRYVKLILTCRNLRRR